MSHHPNKIKGEKENNLCVPGNLKGKNKPNGLRKNNRKLNTKMEN